VLFRSPQNPKTPFYYKIIVIIINGLIINNLIKIELKKSMF